MSTTLIVRNLDDDIGRAVRIRAAGNGRSAEAEHRRILRTVLLGRDAPSPARAAAAARLAEFRARTADRGAAPSRALLHASRPDADGAA